MNIYINSSLGSCLIIIIIAIDYLRRYNTDTFQRKLFIITLLSVFFASLLDFLGHYFETKSGANYELYTLYVWSVYLVMRNCSYYFIAVFIDYFSHGSKKRSKKFFYIVSAFLVLYSVSVIVNMPLGYYFYISKENAYIPGSLYLFNLIISYIPIILIFIDVNLAPKKLSKNQVNIIIIFVFINCIGAGTDVILRTTNLIWPCFTAATLYMYFFIIKSDSKIDSLTGIANRNSFNEYADSLLRHSDNKKYAFIIFDLEHFKEINNNLGQLEGDNALRDIASIIKGSIRNTDFAARFDNDEFVIVTAAENRDEAENNALRIIERINAAVYTQNNKNVRPYRLFIRHGYGIYEADSNETIPNLLNFINPKLHH